MQEIWKDVKGFEGLYQVSNMGNVKSLGRKVYNYFQKERILQPAKINGYLRVALFKDSHCKNYLVHRLVAEHFITNPDNKPQINHKDGNKENNVWTNLEWTTASENQKHAFKNGLGKPLWTNKFGGNHPTSKKVIQYSKDMKFIKLWNSVREAEKELKIGSSSISNCCSGRYKTAGGYIWKYEILERGKN